MQLAIICVIHISTAGRIFRRAFGTIFLCAILAGYEYMHLFRETFLLFLLNMLDAMLTLVWVRSGTATEANKLMAHLLDIGDFTFLAAKVGVGIIMAAVMLRFGYKPIAKPLMTVALTVYIGLMGIHFVTGLSAFGLISESFIHETGQWARSFVALIVS